MLRFIKKSRKFYLKRLMRRRIKMVRKAFMFRSINKLHLIQPSLLITKFLVIHKFELSRRVAMKPNFILNYATLHRLILRKFFLKLYNQYLVLRDTTRIALFKNLRFTFIFKFIVFFFKKTFTFFNNFLISTHLSLLSGSSFIFFEHAFSPSASIQNIQKDFTQLSFVVAKSAVRGLRSLSFLHQNATPTIFNLTELITKFKVFTNTTSPLTAWLSSFEPRTSIRL